MKQNEHCQLTDQITRSNYQNQKQSFSVPTVGHQFKKVKLVHIVELRRKSKMEVLMGKIKCLCGGTAHLESFVSLKTLINGKPEYVWRYVCDRCKQGRFDLRGHSTKQKAYEHYTKEMEFAKELAEEFGVPVSRFLTVVNCW